MLSTREHPDEQEDTLRATAALLSQSLEDLGLAERIKRALNATGYGSLRAVEITVRARVVHLEGRVPSYFLKQLAQETALAAPGEHQVRNDLEVVRPT
jgi:osmotically-inducible protein OsmY